MVKRKKMKLRWQAKLGILLIILLIGITIGGIKLFNIYRYRQSYEYKLLQIEYNLDDSATLIANLTNEELDEILTRDFNSNIVKFAKEKYFLFRNLDRYLDYLADNNELEYNIIVSLINVQRDHEFYEYLIEADLSKDFLILINKYHYIEKDFEPDDIVRASASYAYENRRLKSIAYEAFKNLADDAKLNNHTIVISSGYRTFAQQEEIWQNIYSIHGRKRADSLAARPGHSEHHSGYTIDVADFYDMNDDFGATESYGWMLENAHRFGFILRYPKDKENITGYTYEPWHFRYVGTEVASYIYKNKITFDEYWEFYLAK